MKLSFTISSKPSSCPNNSGESQPAAALPAAAADEPQPQFVTVFDPAPPRPPARPRYVILPIPNTFLLRLREKTKTVSLPLPSDDPTAIPSANPDSTAIPSSLTFRSTANNSDSQIGATSRPEQVSDDPKVSKQRGAQLDKPAAAPLKDAEETVRVSGCHAGLKRKILERWGSSDLISKLLESGEEVRVGEDMVAKLQSREERCLKKLKGLETRQRDEKREESRSQDCRREEGKSRDSRRERRSREEQAKPAEKLTGIGRWLTSHIRVRIINKYFRGGKLYRKTGKVLDVVSPNTCDILMDESGEFLQGVDQEIIETALPKCWGGSVLVLYGKHKGVYGSLVVRDMEEKMGLIIDADSHALIIVCLDQIAEGQAEKEFKVEVEVIGRVRHKNLVRLLGYCVEGAYRMLVYEYVDNGNLEQWLHGDVGEVSPLTWEIRMNIILGTARGLAYVHEGLEPKVVHRDVKASNILLDKQWNPKVSDFGLAKLLCSERSYVTTRVMGTFGYVAPEYASTGMLNERSDVYSFGVLIMEIISGRSPVDYTRPPGEVHLVEWLKTMVGDRKSDMVVDPKMPEKPSSKALKRALLVALRCVDPDSHKRPKMGHLIHLLEVDDLPVREDHKQDREVSRSRRHHSHGKQ